MNDLWIARGLQDGRILLFNRWSLQVAHVLAIFKQSYSNMIVNFIYSIMVYSQVFFCAINDDPEEEHDSAVLQCVQLGEDIVVAGYRDGIICVWDLTTKELVQFQIVASFTTINSYNSISIIYRHKDTRLAE
jgi:hypothetical protein